MSGKCERGVHCSFSFSRERVYVPHEVDGTGGKDDTDGKADTDGTEGTGIAGERDTSLNVNNCFPNEVSNSSDTYNVQCSLDISEMQGIEKSFA